ncbi:MAG TPA: hypothetical protein VLT45_07800 [Kofleriaceae bacterium]|nr:hypothetical protein [Kofleriaceae bacterium]
MTVEADAGTETETSSNGVASRASMHADARAAFLAGDVGDDAGDDVDAKKAPADAKDDDSDLDDADEDRDEVEADDEDDDKDKDLEDDEDDDEDDKKAPDKETARRLETVQRTDKRLREERERQFAAREAEINGQVDSLRKEWEPRIAAPEKFERLAARANIDPVAVLQALGVTEDRYEHAAQVLYTLAKAKDDPKARTAAAQLMKARELDEEISQLKKWREDREKAEKDREQQTAADREVDAFISNVTKAASDKTPLAKSLLKNDPDGAREELQIVAFRLAKETGRLPEAKAVMIALEKHQRAKLRKLGIDPKARGAAEALTESTAKTTTAKTGEKKTAKKATTTVVDDDKPLTKEEYVRLSGKYD